MMATPKSKKTILWTNQRVVLSSYGIETKVIYNP